MPDASGFPTPDEIINGYTPKDKIDPPKPVPTNQLVQLIVPGQVTPEIQKFLGMVQASLMGKAHVFLVFTETFDKDETHPNGCDIHSVVGGDKIVIDNMRGDIPPSIDRAINKYIGN